jgi:hypothetical protein
MEKKKLIFFYIDTLCNARKKISKTLPTGYEKG